MTTLTPLEMIRIWRQGCSNSRHDHPEECAECTAGLVNAMEAWLHLPLWKRVWLNSRGYDWLRKFVAWKVSRHQQDAETAWRDKR